MANNMLHPQTDDPVSEAQIDCILRDTLRVPELFAAAYFHLKPEHFHAASEPHYRVLWRVVQRLVKDNGDNSAFLFEDPKKVRTLVETEVRTYVENNSDEIIDEYVDQLFSDEPKAQGLIPWIYTSDEVELNPKYSRVYLSKFLDERGVQLPLRRALADSGNRSVKNLPAILQHHIELSSSFNSVNVNPVRELAPSGWQPKPQKKFSTGVEFLDKMLGGGQADGEVYGILGAYGSGKTVLGVQIATQTAVAQVMQKNLLAMQGKTYEPRHSYLFHYEAGEEEIRVRSWSHLCSIPWTELQEFDMSKLSSTAKGPKPYESDRFKEKIESGTFLGEQERLKGLSLYENYIHLVDMSGPPDSPKRGTGYVQEIAQILATWTKGQSIGVVVIDYAGLCSRRYMNANNLPHDRLRHLVGNFGDECRRLIASPFSCPVWVMHQLAAAQNKRSPSSKQHHSDAAEAKNFAENLWFSFQMGVPEDVSRCLSMTCTKARRAGIPTPAVLRIDGAFSTMVDASKDFFFDELQGKFVSVTEASSFMAQTSKVMATIAVDQNTKKVVQSEEDIDPVLGPSIPKKPKKKSIELDN